MDDDQLLHAELEDRSGRMAQGDGVEHALLADLEAGHLARLVLVHDRVVGVLQGWDGDGLEPVAGLADEVDAGLQSSRLGGLEHLGGVGDTLLVQGIHLVQQQQVTEMEDAGLGLGEIEVLGVPEGIRPTVVEEGALARALHRHHVGVAGRRLARGLEVLGVDLVGDAIVEDVLAVGILSDETCTRQREPCPHLGEVHEDIVRGTARALALGLDVGQLFELGIGVDDLDLIHDPVAAGEDAGALGGSG